MEYRVERIELLAAGPVEVQWRKIVKDGSDEYDMGPHRRVFTPGDKLENLPKEFVDLIAQHWSKDRVAMWKDAVKKMERESNANA